MIVVVIQSSPSLITSNRPLLVMVCVAFYLPCLFSYSRYAIFVVQGPLSMNGQAAVEGGITPWCFCHFRGQDLLALGLGNDVLIVDASAFLLVQRFSVVSASDAQNTHSNKLDMMLPSLWG